MPDASLHRSVDCRLDNRPVAVVSESKSRTNYSCFVIGQQCDLTKTVIAGRPSCDSNALVVAKDFCRAGDDCR